MPLNNYIKEDILSSTEVALTTNSSIIDIRALDGLSVVCQVIDSSPSAINFVDGDVDLINDTVTEVAHGYLTGLKGQLTTTGTLPGGLALLTDYYLIKVDDDTFKFATSAANAEAGITVDIISAAGGGTHTFTPAVLSMNVIYQGSIDNSTFVNVSTQAITTTCNVMFNIDRPHYLYGRIQFEISAGQITIEAQSCKESE